jgi:hypothetical protein
MPGAKGRLESYYTRLKAGVAASHPPEPHELRILPAQVRPGLNGPTIMLRIRTMFFFGKYSVFDIVIACIV